MLGTFETAWLFTRGGQSVRIVRAATREGSLHLDVHGPGETRHSLTFDDVVECMQHQSHLERRLVGQGFMLESFTSDRRSAERRRFTGHDRRQP